jgi:hypothetical protein
MAPYPGPPPPPHPGPLPYPGPSRRWLFVVAVTVIAVVATLAAVLGYAVHDVRAARRETITETSAKAAIQGYLNALADRDIDAVARNTLCGIYDGVTDRRTDDAVATMSSDAFHRQFSRAEVTSIDKIVHLSRYQAQALFTMRVTPALGAATQRDVQGVAQLLSTDHRILVCSYLLRSTGNN